MACQHTSSYSDVIPIFILAVVLLCFTKPAGFMQSKASVDLTTANNICKQFRTEHGMEVSLPQDQTATQHDDLIRYLTEHKLKTIWLPYRNILFNNTQWLNGQDVDRSLIYGQRNLKNGQCGILHARDERFEMDHCGTPEYGYICQKQDCYQCPSGKYEQDCFIINRTCYIVACGVNNWFAARDKCRDAGNDLLIMCSSALLQRLSGLIKGNTRKTKKNNKFWVGVLDGGWFAEDYVNKVLVPMDKSRWSEGEPQTDNNCSIAELQDDRVVWKSTSCFEKHSFNCFKETSPRETSTSVPLVPENSNDPDAVTPINQDVNSTTCLPAWATILIAVLPTITVVIAATFCYRMIKKQKGFDIQRPGDPSLVWYQRKKACNRRAKDEDEGYLGSCSHSTARDEDHSDDDGPITVTVAIRGQN